MANIPGATSKANSVTELQAEVKRLQEQNKLLKFENEYFRARYKLQSQRIFGPSSEKRPEGSLSLFVNQAGQTAFDEAEATLACSDAEELAEPTAQGIRQRKRGKSKEVGKANENRATDQQILPREEVIHALPEEKCFCQKCSGALHVIGSQDSETLVFVPPHWKVVCHKRLKYGCRGCEKAGERTSPVAAPAKVPLIPGSMASPSALGYILSSKYELGLPLYRLEKYFGDRGFYLTRQTMSNWIISTAEWFKPLFYELRKLLLAQDIIHADETTVQVLNEPDKEPTSKSQMWVYTTGKHGPPLVLFDYQPSRKKECPATFLAGYKGVIHADGYQAYEALEGANVSACWAHARRYFDRAIQVEKIPKGVPKREVACHQGLAFCQALYAIEKKIKDSDSKTRYSTRQSESRQILGQMKIWLDAQSQAFQYNHKTKEAVTYCLNQWEKLNHYLTDERLEIDNNRCERAIRPFVVGRKNWLFANAPSGATSSAIIYSLVETAKANNLVPQAYMEHLLETVPNIPPNDKEAILKLLPWHPDIQAKYSKASRAKG